MLAGLGLAALIIGFILLGLNKKKGLGLEDPNINEPQAEIMESEVESVEQ